MSNFKFILVLVFFSKILFAGSSSNSIVAIHNDDAYTTNEFGFILDPNIMKSEKINLINDFINQKILINEIQKRNIEPSKEQLNEELQKIAKYNNLTTLELISNKNFNEIVVNTTNALKIKIFLDVISENKIEITKKEIDLLKSSPDFQSKNQVLYSFGVISIPYLSTSDDDMLKKEKLINSLYNRIYNNEAEFTALEKKYSTNKLSDKDYPFLDLSEIPLDFHAFLLDNEKLKISKPLKVKDNFVILKIFDKKYIDLSDSIAEKILKESKQKNILNEWIKTERNKHYINIFSEKIN